MTSTDQNDSLRGAFVAVTSLFLMWGFITSFVDILVPKLKLVFDLSATKAYMVQFAWFTAYGLLSIPGGYVIKKLGCKLGIILGLVVAGLGCAMFFPAAETEEFSVFLLALFITGCGITILQVAANPYVSVLGPKESASSRLNLAQAFNSLGTTVAPLIAASFLLGTDAGNAGSVKSPFLVIAMSFFLLAALFSIIKLPAILGEEGKNGSYTSVLQDRKLRFGAVAIFVYVGAEVAIASGFLLYAPILGIEELKASIVESSWLSQLGEISAWLKGEALEKMDSLTLVGSLIAMYWGGAMVGRFLGSGLMARMKPTTLLAGAAIGAMLMIAFSFGAEMPISAYMFLIAIGFFNSIMFPTIFAIAIEDLGDDKPLGSGVLCTAIVGGAFVPLLFGALVDTAGFGAAYLLPAICYGYIAWYAGRLVPSVRG